MNEIQNPKSKIQNPLIVALDVPTADQAREIVAELRDSVGAFKVGLQLFTAEGANFVRELVRQEVKVFLDLKFHDIPNTAAAAGIEAARCGVWMFNVHALGGGEMMRRTIEQVREVCAKENLHQPKIIAVTVLTSADAASLREVGIGNAVETEVVKLAKLAAECELDGVVASPNEIELIRANVKNKEFLIVTPGIRPNFATFDDQKRVMTPGEAIRGGADFLVIGRPILNAADRLSAVRQIFAEIA